MCDKPKAKRIYERKHATNAARQAAYRASRKLRGLPGNKTKTIPGSRGYKSQRDKSKWEFGQFIALDGEGENVGENEKFVIGKGKKEKTYYAKEHRYTMLASSTGESLFNGGKRLQSMDCISWLCDLSLQYKKAIFVIFAGGYDINHMLMFGFEREKLKQIASGETIEFEHNKIIYQLEYRARKSLTIRRGKSTVKNAKGKWIQKWETKLTIWDVFGYFQESFTGVIGKWLGKEHRHFELIKRMKKLRGNFADIPQAEINAYNAAELECLVELMEKVREAVDGLGLQLKRWDGAGSVAAAILQKHGIKEFKAPTPNAQLEAVRCAYAGGRIEVCKAGNHNKVLYDYDINSAYPSMMMDMPCLAHGIWQHTVADKDIYTPPAGFTVVHIRWELPEYERFYPFFYRTDKMQISFPSTGEGWYWYPEYAAGMEHYGEYITVLEWHHFKPHCNHKPFHWIGDYYNTRQQWVKNPTEAWQSGGEKIIKLGLNSLYGKTAQQIGGRDDNPPAYHQLEWAGYITSATRAKLYLAARTDPDAIIGFATDGIFSIRELPIEQSTTKQIGMWSLTMFEGLVTAMAGVYWWIKEDGSYSHFSRGFDKDSMETPDLVLNAWKAGADKIDIPMHRLIGMGSACASDTLWKMRGRFTEGMRTLRLDGKSHKRVSLDVTKTKPHKKLIDLHATANFEYDPDYPECSFPYPLRWVEDDIEDDWNDLLELIKENSDTDNI